MAVYTVKKLAKLSGTSIRTLHFYDEVGLLKPAYYGANGYRYYEEKQLLLLQQILFFRELGVELKKIQKVLGRSDFDQLAALHSHRRTLEKGVERTKQLIQTIDNTIKHLNGKIKMKDKEIFDGFNIALVKKSKNGESYTSAEEIVGKSVKNPTKSVKDVQERGKAFYDNITAKTHAIFKDLIHCIEKGLDPATDEVQMIIKKHHSLADEIHDANKEVYKALAELYRDHPEFRKQLDPFHPKLAEYMAEAMEIFADRKL